ncbi:MAG: CCA tRNA nucleotidyltransferase [Candidatus Poribacteria bacterium]
MINDSKIPPQIRDLLQEIGKEAHQPIYVVGGFVRDLLLRRENLDLDIVIEGDAIAFAQYLTDKWDGRLQSYRKFGTATVTRADGFKIDFVSARSETYERPAALPLVRWGTIEDDLHRRDFSMNALAMDLNPDRFGALVDCTDGLKDLRAGNIRVLHNQSFINDPTRIFRAIRYEQRYGFQIVENDQTLIREAICQGVLEFVSGQRIRNEIDCIQAEETVPRTVQRLREFDLFRAIQPKWNVPVDFAARWNAARKAIDWASKYLSEDKINIDAMLWMTLLGCLHATEAVSNRLELKNQLRSKLIAKESLCETLDQLNPDSKPSEVYMLLKPYPLEALVFTLMQVDWQTENIKNYLIKLRHVQPLISGDDLIQLGLKPGRCFTDLLWKAFSAQLDGKVFTKQEIYQQLRITDEI